MLTADKSIPQGRGLAAALLRRAPTVVLDWASRRESRFDASDSSGRALAVSLADGHRLRGGDVLVAEDGSLVRVVAAPQPVLVVRPCSEHGTPADLLRAAYHLGRRRIPLELHPDHLKLAPDDALADLLRRQHLIVEEALAAFEPEDEDDAFAAAAHVHGHAHGHAHDHGHDHAHDHMHDHAQDHAHDQTHAHVHGPGSGHARGDDQGHHHGDDHGHDDGHDHEHRHGSGLAHAHGHAPGRSRGGDDASV